MSWQAKMIAFDHLTFRMAEWYSEKNGSWEMNNDLSKLKLTKLLFFVTAATATPNYPGLLETFDDFAAMPYGHVESTIQDHMQDSAFFNIDRNGLRYQQGIEHYNIDQFDDNAIKQQIDAGVISLKNKNPDLIVMNAFELVDLSHRWQSWITIFSLAKQSGKLSMPIPSEMIMSEPKFFK